MGVYIKCIYCICLVKLGFILSTTMLFGKGKHIEIFMFIRMDPQLIICLVTNIFEQSGAMYLEFELRKRP